MNFTDLEKNILKLLANGETKKDILIKLSINQYLYDKLLKNCLQKLKTNTKTEAIYKAIHLKIID